MKAESLRPAGTPFTVHTNKGEAPPKVVCALNVTDVPWQTLFVELVMLIVTEVPCVIETV